MAKKAKGKLPSVDRSRGLPTRSAWSLKKTLVIAVLFTVAVLVYNSKTNPDNSVPSPTTIVDQR